MVRKLLLGSLGLVMLVCTVLTAAWMSLRAPATPAGRLLATSDAERYLLAAAREGETDIVQGLVKAGTPVEARDARGFSPIILAAYYGHTQTVQALLDAGADACAGDSRGNTALMGAAFKGYADVVKLLSAQPCAVDQTNRLGQTALMFAVLFGRTEVADQLRHQGASPALRDASGRSANDWAQTQTPDAPVAPTPLPDAPTAQVR
ncbi:ankyrin repeat domain-containing protein [Corallococcus sp. AB011P]|uniref:ankyrin repeat domain-containing protein n=1 Tax=unclassified Corallococcus TaxID=2685029 RepID=UPI000EA221DC|nr:MULTISPECIES: ankyrin repeat domain-containing protein [unclassified Corallococcus]RKG59398.1 ankyrin repeat domain-containing protein [Corallococcus sp. AB011P]RKH90859.1 ankyrin repeat domain-containing protein [Corallococcus sp. AB045]